jgi:iron complex outermembrane recepter protein
VNVHGRTLRAFALGSIVLVHATTVSAQRASENAVLQANDAFGTTVGYEQIGIYSPYLVRGFSPTLAGNVRIEGLYFDQVTQLNPRIEDSSQIRVGIAAQGYAFPAPTGVVDYALREPGDTPELSVLSEVDTRGTSTLEFDGVEPVIDNTLTVGGGAGFHRYVDASGFSDYEINDGALIKWTPTSTIEVLPFFSRTDFDHEVIPEAYAPEGPFLPEPNPGRHFFGPSWAINNEFDVNFGTLVWINLPDNWELRAGVFRSVQKKPTNIYLQLSGLTRQASGELDAFSDPPSTWGSTSGEVRLQRDYTDGPLVHRLILSLRMRDYNATYAGTDFLDLGAAEIGQYLNLPKPDFQFSAQSHDHIEETIPGLSYQLVWKSLGALGISIQKPHYTNGTAIPGAPFALSSANPWLFNVALTANVSHSITLYADFTEGLEDNGIAPENASNRNEPLPAIATKQKDGGVRYNVTPKVTLVAGLFDIDKPYFNLGPMSLYSQLGGLSNKGLELSLDGDVLPSFHIVAGAVLSQPQVAGEAVRLGQVGRDPINIPSRQVDINATWLPLLAPYLSFDAEVSHESSVASVLNDSVFIPEKTFVNADARYSFRLDGRSASLRFWIENLLDRRSWDVADSNTYDIYGFGGRHLDFRLIVDI